MNEVTTATRCPSLMGRIFGHKFDRMYRNVDGSMDNQFITCGTIVSVCTRCGYKIVVGKE